MQENWKKGDLITKKAHNLLDKLVPSCLKCENYSNQKYLSQSKQLKILQHNLARKTFKVVNSHWVKIKTNTFISKIQFYC